MRFSTVTSVVLVTAVSSAAGKNTYLKSSEGDYWLGFEQTGYTNDVTMVFFNKLAAPHRSQPWGQAVHINNDTTLDIGGSNFGIYLPPWGPANLTGFGIDFEDPSDAPPDAKGFSWSANDTLQLSDPNFHGWVHCQGGDFSGTNVDGNDPYTSFYLATDPNSPLPQNCTKIDLVKYEW